MAFRILIMGLPGAGKTTLAKQLVQELRKYQFDVTWLNADDVRTLTNNWDFSNEGRILQAHTLRRMADESPTDLVVADFVAPLPAQRAIFCADYIIWLDTIQEGRFADTNAAFQPPTYCDYHISDWSDNHIENILTSLLS